MIQQTLDWLKLFIKDKGGVFILGGLIGGGIGFAYYKSEKIIKEYVVERNTELKQDLLECKRGRETDKQDFLNNMREVWYFSEQLKGGFKEAEISNRKEAENKAEVLKTLNKPR